MIDESTNGYVVGNMASTFYVGMASGNAEIKTPAELLAMLRAANAPSCSGRSGGVVCLGRSELEIES
jgi:hypothetical protein